MADFSGWAVQYVLSDDEKTGNDIARKAASAIEASHANSTVVGTWASSVHQWMNGADDNVITRAKALGYLVETLKYLDQAVLRYDQVQFLATFFGSMFSNDHKAGIEASAQALACLRTMKKFDAGIGLKMVEDVLQIQEDFSRQTPNTRHELYQLILSLVGDDAICSQLQDKYGDSARFVVDFVKLSQRERDPKNLLVLFTILKTFLTKYTTSEAVTEEIFQAFSNYFPVSLNKNAAPMGITTDDLKSALRECFASHWRLAPLTLPFLLQRLDKGGGVSLEVEAVSIKVDVLQTLKYCIDRYDGPQASLVPHVNKIWDSLKFEVRHGEVKERINATLDVFRSIANRLHVNSQEASTGSNLRDFLDMVSSDCEKDLDNPTYTKQAGLLWATAVTANIGAFGLQGTKMFLALRQKTRASKSTTHTRDLLGILRIGLEGRQKLVSDWEKYQPAELSTLQEESPSYIEDIWLHDLAPLFSDAQEPQNDEVLAQALQAVALLATQQSLFSAGKPVQSCSVGTYRSIVAILGHRLFPGLASSPDAASPDSALDGDCLLALRRVSMHYHAGFTDIVNLVLGHFQSWPTGNEFPAGSATLDHMRLALSRLAFVGCSEIARDVVVPGSEDSGLVDNPQTGGSYSALQHFITLTNGLLQLVYQNRIGTGLFLSTPDGYFTLVSGVYGVMLNFHDACLQKYGAARQSPPMDNGEMVWPRDSKTAAFGQDFTPVAEDDPECHSRFLRICLFVARALYRNELLTPPPSCDDRVLGQMGNMMAFVVRNLDEDVQRSYRLGEQTYRLFLDSPGDTTPSGHERRNTEPLTLGILEGLYPGAMTDLFEPAGWAETFLCDVTVFAKSSPAISWARARIGALLANKYPQASPTGRLSRVFEFWGGVLTQATAKSDGNGDAAEAVSVMALSIMAGALARQDRDVLRLAPVLQEAIAGNAVYGEALARSTGLLVKKHGLLTPDNHARVSKLSTQRTYHVFIKPLYERAVPLAKGPEAERCANAIMGAVIHCPFAVYQDDTGPLTRLLVTVLHTKPNSPEITSALGVFRDILANDPGSLKGHLTTIINGATAAYQGALQDSRSRRTGGSKRQTEWKPEQCRKKALELLSAIPGKCDVAASSSTSGTLRMLANASADPVRDLRKLALQARENWAKLGLAN